MEITYLFHHTQQRLFAYNTFPIDREAKGILFLFFEYK